MCDQISDAILDWCLVQDKNSRVAVEVMGGHGKIVVMGEVTTKNIDLLGDAIKNIVNRIAGTHELSINIVNQSSEIANGVNTGGAGDQGIMVGYACDDNAEMIPQELFYARSLCKYLFERYPYDGKTQVTMDEYKVTSIVASFQNVPSGVLAQSIADWIHNGALHLVEDFKDVVVHANPAGDWTIGGFDADTGLTGRKIIVDAYGPQVSIGGGAFSGKDPSKVDRSGAYMARRIAVDTMIRMKAKEVTVKLAYAIGVAEPVMAVAFVKNGTTVTEHNLLKGDLKHLTPNGIREFLKLNQPQYEETAKWGHMGCGFTWDKLDNDQSK